MKKTYIAPALSVTIINAEELICLSMQQGKADNSTVLGKERGQMGNDSEPVYGNLW